MKKLPALRDLEDNLDAERKAFEEWYEANAMPAEANWFKRDANDPTVYAYEDTSWAWYIWQAARRCKIEDN